MHRSQNYIRGHPARTGSTGDMAITVKLLPKQSTKEGLGSSSSLCLVSCQCSHWPTLAESLGKKFQEQESQTAQLGRANLTIHIERLNKNSQSDRKTGAGCRTQYVFGHHQKLKTTRVHDGRGWWYRLQGAARAHLHGMRVLPKGTVIILSAEFPRLGT